MVRVLALIAFIGFILSVTCFAGAVAIGGRDIAENGWRFPEDWHVDVDDDEDRVHIGRGDPRWESSGPDATREIAWTGGETLEVSVPADVRYTQAAGPGKLVVTGPREAVDNLELDGDSLRFDDPLHGAGRLTIVMTAPGVKRFELHGRNKLVITGFKQDRLAIDMTGSAEVTAEGEVKDLDLEISGSGEADMGRLVTENARVDIAGSGEATVAPRGNADLDISGSGEITLLSRPARLRSNATGSGRIVQAAPDSAAAPETSTAAPPAAAGARAAK